MRQTKPLSRMAGMAPLGIKHHWKRTYLGVVDSEGGLYLDGAGLAKIGYLVLHDGSWDGALRRSAPSGT